MVSEVQSSGDLSFELPVIDLERINYKELSLDSKESNWSDSKEIWGPKNKIKPFSNQGFYQKSTLIKLDLDKPIGEKSTSAKRNVLETVELSSDERTTAANKNHKNSLSLLVYGAKISRASINKLLNGKWINDEVISSYIQCKLKEKDKSSIFLLYSSSATEILHNRKFLNYKKTNFSQYSCLIGSISLDNVHWVCFYASLANNNFIFLDPKGSTEFQRKEIFKNWIDFSSQRSDLKTSWVLKQINHPIQTDSNNCEIDEIKLDLGSVKKDLVDVNNDLSNLNLKLDGTNSKKDQLNNNHKETKEGIDELKAFLLATAKANISNKQ
ncbi:unnamed protein product [Brachionus calyciflorus]|uniref:Ubiquitin-like protease family profile domain-containing protein n=1 Tax=Brachionus calyciflorus TaxID=104777 RepID=A0A814M2K3_9BILA|nr:unnamed protein product [Brachionus calyciflorus]